MKKIGMNTPLVEMDGDEMTRVIWAMIKDILLKPYVDLKTEYYDLGLPSREASGDKVTHEAAAAVKRLGVGVKCATITPNAQRVTEYNLTQMWKSPNGTIRAVLDGTVFRTPIMVKGIVPYIPTWEKPITIARHAYGDIYKDVEAYVSKGEKASLVVSGKTSERVLEIFDFSKTSERVLEIFDFSKTGGVVMGMHNTDASVRSFARSCFNYALDRRQDLWFAAKDTISKTYDHRFKDIFADIFTKEYEDKFKEAGVEYFYTLIDDAVARVIRSKGGMIWACKNYDGDVMSDMVATAFGSLAMMTSVLVSPDGNYEYEAAHGTVTRHYYKYKAGQTTSTNPVATIFAWSGALRKRGQLDGNDALAAFGDKLERATIDTIEAGEMTGDLAAIWKGEAQAKTLSTEEFLKAVAKRLD